MHSLQECFFAVFIEGNMSGSHNLKYYVWSIMLVLCKRNKVQSHNITKQFKWSRSENTANETREIENIQNEQQTEQEDIEQLERDHSMVVTEASSCSASNPELQVSEAACTAQPTTTVSTKRDLTRIEKPSQEQFYWCNHTKYSLYFHSWLFCTS